MSANKNENITRLTVNEKESIKIAMQAIDSGALGIALIINDKGEFVGLVTDGDVRRAILRGVQIESPVQQIMNTSPVVIQGELTEEKLLALRNSETVKSRQKYDGLTAFCGFYENFHIADITLNKIKSFFPIKFSKTMVPIQ